MKILFIVPGLGKARLERCREHALALSSSRYDDRVLAERLSALYRHLIKGIY